MDNKLQIREVDFNGAALMAAQDAINRKIYVGVSWVCNGIGLTKGQKDRQVENLQQDLVLQQGCRKFAAGVFDPNNETLAIELDYLPLWLAKISITPKMQTEQPELADKLFSYQLKAKDVLAEAFLPQTNHPPQVEELIIMQAQSVLELKAEVKQLVDKTEAQNARIEGIRNIVALNPSQWRKETGILINRMAESIGGFEHLSFIRNEIYSQLDARYRVCLKTRLGRMQERMANRGVPKSKYENISVVDVIAEDCKLIEGYIAIVKEMAIKYGVAA